MVFKISELRNSLKYYGFSEYSIRESFKIIEKAGIKDKKFTVLRHLLSHPTLGGQSWFKTFHKNYGPHYFDYKKYDINTLDVVVDFESNKTQRELNNLAAALIAKCKILLGL